MKLGKLQKTILVVAFSTSLIGCSQTPTNTSPVMDTGVADETTPMNDESLTEHQIAWITDIDGPIRTALSKAAGINEIISDDERNARLDELIEQIKTEHLDDSQIAYGFHTLYSDIGIAHGGLIIPNEYRTEKENIYYTMIGEWFGDEYRIISTLPKYEEALGKCLVAINDVPLDEVLASYDSFISNETHSWLKTIFRNANQYGFSQFELEYTGIIEKDVDTVKFTLSDGTSTTDINVSSTTYSNENPTNCVSVYDLVESFPLGFDLYLSSEKANFNYVLDEENRAMYFQYNKCLAEETSGAESGYPNFADFFDEMISVMKTHEASIDCFIIDVRLNTGGSEALFNAASAKYAQYLNQYPIKILIGNTTFSAGVDCIDTALYDFDDVTLYGEETGLAVHNYTSIIETPLEHTGGSIWTPEHLDYCYVIDKRAEDTSKGVLPDVEISQSYENFLLGIDDVYMTAVSN